MVCSPGPAVPRRVFRIIHQEVGDMCSRFISIVTLAVALLPSTIAAQTNPLWHEVKIRNYLPHMTWPEVRDLLTRSDVALIPVPALEQHGPQAPIGTDFFAGVERLKLIAQQTDALVVPVLLAGQSPYHMDFPGRLRSLLTPCSGCILKPSRVLYATAFAGFC